MTHGSSHGSHCVMQWKQLFSETLTKRSALIHILICAQGLALGQRKSWNSAQITDHCQGRLFRDPQQSLVRPLYTVIWLHLSWYLRQGIWTAGYPMPSVIPTVPAFKSIVAQWFGPVDYIESRCFCVWQATSMSWNSTGLSSFPTLQAPTLM